jgi:8-oxo-dGTP pyrophosphatase MutT (NUDIX family)
MQVVYTFEDAPEAVEKSIFLVGPTPRDPETKSWRPEMIEALERAGYDGVVFVPEFRDWKVLDDYLAQVSWEKRHLEMADIILAWVPRCLKTMPSFTTNCEFGTWIDSGKLVYGRPDESPKNSYLDWMYEDRKLGKPFNNVDEIAKAVTERLKKGALRKGGERFVPIDIFNTHQFQNWYAQQREAGNRLDQAKVLYQFKINNKYPFCHILWAKMWVEAEQRHKENEFVFSRSDVVSVLAVCDSRYFERGYHEPEILLVREYRTPARTGDACVLELPGGSSKNLSEHPLITACHELQEETGLVIEEDRFVNVPVGARQLVATLSSHVSTLFVVELTKEEIEAAKASKGPRGVVEDTERTYVEVLPLSTIVAERRVDWSTLGQIYQGLDALKGFRYG